MRLWFTLLAAPLIVAGGYAVAQGGGLAGVTMRVVDDLSGIDAAVLELEAAPTVKTEDTDDGERPAAEERQSEDAPPESVERAEPVQPPA